MPLPYLEATNSRINIKNGLEKLPFSLVDADLSFWQEKPGDWRVRLRGQPARTDVSLDLADTGVVGLEASMRRAPELRQMPVHVDMEWSEAQLGQLSRLIIGSDPGWRGDLTGELHLDGTAESAQVKTRLRATGVHRAEFAPAAPLDFDANCGFVYHYSQPHRREPGVRLASRRRPHPGGGRLPEDGQPRLSVELQRIPVQAGLDVLRTLRSGIGEGLEAKGTVSGKLTYDARWRGKRCQQPAPAQRSAATNQIGEVRPQVQRPLTGSLVVAGFALSGGGLSQPIQIPKITLEPAPASGTGAGAHHIDGHSRGRPEPLAVAVRLALQRISGAVARPGRIGPTAGVGTGGRHCGCRPRWARCAEIPRPGPERAGSLATDAGGDLQQSIGRRRAGTGPCPAGRGRCGADRLTGTMTLHNANWKSDLLASHVEISQATLHLGGRPAGWDPVEFSYGPVKGTASLQVPLACEDGRRPCPPRLEVHFADLDAGKLQAALLGARKAGHSAVHASGAADSLRSRRSGRCWTDR